MVGTFVIYSSILIGMVLSVVQVPVSLPPELGYVRPDWVAMVLVYWVIAVPNRIGLFTAWVVGMIMDVLLGGLMGQHALSYVIITYIAANLYQRLRMFSVWQQAAIIFAILGLSHIVGFWAESIAGLSEWSFWYLLPAATGAFLWPWIFLLIRYFRRRYGVT